MFVDLCSTQCYSVTKVIYLSVTHFILCIHAPAGGLRRRHGARQASDVETVLRDTRTMEQLRAAADWLLERAYAKVKRRSGAVTKTRSSDHSLQFAFLGDFKMELPLYTASHGQQHDVNVVDSPPDPGPHSS